MKFEPFQPPSWNCVTGEKWKVPKWAKGGMHTKKKRLGTKYHKGRNKAIKILNTKIPTDPYKMAIFPIGNLLFLQKPKNIYCRIFPYEWQHWRQTTYHRDLMCILEDLLSCYCYATKANSKTISSRVCSLPLQAKKRILWTASSSLHVT